MVSPLQQVNELTFHAVNQAMFTGDPPRPDPRAKPFKRFGFADTGKRIPAHGFHEFCKLAGHLGVGGDPITKVFKKVRIDQESIPGF